MNLINIKEVLNMFWKEFKATSLDELIDEILKERKEPDKPLTLVKLFFDNEPNELHLVKIENFENGVTHYKYSFENFLSSEPIKENHSLII
jgi:hypothetical protein